MYIARFTNGKTCSMKKKTIHFIIVLCVSCNIYDGLHAKQHNLNMHVLCVYCIQFCTHATEFLSVYKNPPDESIFMDTCIEIVSTDIDTIIAIIIVIITGTCYALYAHTTTFNV